MFVGAKIKNLDPAWHGILLYGHSSSDKEIVGRVAGERPAVEKMC